MERKANRHKASLRSHPTCPTTFDELEELPLSYTQTFDGDRFLILNKVIEQTGSPRILVFASNTGLNLLKLSETWSSDGTFSVAPEPFSQFYTIMAEYEGKSFPAVFAFLPNKKAGTYDELFEVVKTFVPDRVLTRFLVDFEAAVHKEVRAVLGKSVQVSGCMVHMSRNIRKHLCSLPHMQSLLYKNAQFNVFVKCILGLCYVPVGCVLDFYKELMDQELPEILQALGENKENESEYLDDVRESITQFLDYLEKTYLGHRNRLGWTNPRFDLELWNQHETVMALGQQTTNQQEAFNSAFRRLVPLNSGFWSVMDNLQDYEAKVRVQLDEHRSGKAYERPDKRRRSKQDEELRKVVSKWQDYEKVDFLIRVSHIGKLDD